MRKVSFKISDSVEESHAVQRMLFDSGAEWLTSGKQVQDYQRCLIDVDARGVMTVAYSKPEYSVLTHSLETTVKVIDNRPRIVFQGATYLVADVEHAILISNVRPV